MHELIASSVRYGSEGDERAFFEWLGRIGCVGKCYGVVRDLRILLKRPPSDAELRELIAIFDRYGVDMAQLAALETKDNVGWFRKPGTYWHHSVFAVRSALA
jgi:hypothetical protein